MPLLVGHDPPFGPRQRGPAEEPDGPALVAVQQPVEQGEAPAPGGQRCLGATALTAPELVDPDVDPPHRPVVRHDAQGDHRLAGPACEVIDVEREPPRQEHKLGREHRELLPRPQAEEGQPDACEDPGRLDPTGGEHILGRPKHVRRVGGVAGQAEGQVGLDRGRELRWATIEVGPRAVVALVGPDPLRAGRRLLFGSDAEELAEQEILRVHRHVGLELALPVARGLLHGQEGIARRVEALAGRPRLASGHRRPPLIDRRHRSRSVTNRAMATSSAA